MSMNLVEQCNLALEAYASALNIIARRAGASSQPTNIDDKPILRQAGRLALPAVGADHEEALPALQSLMGHLRDGRVDAYYTPQRLDMEPGTIIPSLERPADLAGQYASMWSAMQRELAAIDPDAAPPVREVATLGILQRYGWSMAAPGAGDTDVTLYDYARVQAALAVCLAEQPAATGEVALLVGGDVSGVQDWLYTIGSEGAAKSLRGRSVYLQLLSEIIAQWLLDSLGLPSCNLLYAGGGNFYILAPLSASAQLEALQVAMTRRLLKMHDGALYVALGHTEVTRADLEQQKVGAAWGCVNAAMNLRKRRRFAELTDDDEMARAIGSALAGTGKLEDSCRVCRRPIGQDEKPPPNEDGERVCQICGSFEDLGNRLPNADFLVVSRLSKASAAEAVLDWRAGLRQFGYDVQFVWQDRQGRGAWQAPASDLVRIYFWKPEQSTLDAFPGVPDPTISVWLYRPLAQAVSMRDGRVATFDQLETEGIQRWGVLRMDVDKLGAIFQQGVQPASLSRVAGLSGMLRLFFEGYVPQLARDFNANGPRIYLMYAGGDDLFIVGGWSHLPELAWEIREALREFAAGNDKLTISAGISLALSKSYPIYQAAQDAGEAEEMAKREGRNRIAFLGQAVEWKRFIAVRKQTLEMSAWFTPTTSRAPRSILTNLATVYAEWHSYRRRELGQLTKQGQKGLYKNHTELFLGPWQWHLLYGINRAKKRMTDDSLRDGIDDLVTSVLHGEIRHLGLEIRWVELLTRTRSEDNK